MRGTKTWAQPVPLLQTAHLGAQTDNKEARRRQRGLRHLCQQLLLRLKPPPPPSKDACMTAKDENGTEISQTEPNRFLYWIRSNLYFLVRLYRFRFCILDVSYFKCKSRKRFRHFSTVFYFSTFNLKYFEFKIWFKSNLVNCTVTQPQLQSTHQGFVFFLLVASYVPASY